MGDASRLRAVLRAVFVPCPRRQSREDVEIAAAAIDRLVVEAGRMKAMSRAGAVDDLAESR